MRDYDAERAAKDQIAALFVILDDSDDVARRKKQRRADDQAWRDRIEQERLRHVPPSAGMRLSDAQENAKYDVRAAMSSMECTAGAAAQCAARDLLREVEGLSASERKRVIEERTAQAKQARAMYPIRPDPYPALVERTRALVAAQIAAEQAIALMTSGRRFKWLLWRHLKKDINRAFARRIRDELGKSLYYWQEENRIMAEMGVPPHIPSS